MLSALGRYVALVALAGMLGACSLAPVRPATDQLAKAPRVYRDAIDIGGRLSVRYQQQGEQLVNGNFSWIQRPDDTQVTLLSPFGQSVARITINPGLASFELAGKPPKRRPTSMNWPPGRSAGRCRSAACGHGCKALFRPPQASRWQPAP